jgi:hypothetical protein
VHGLLSMYSIPLHFCKMLRSFVVLHARVAAAAQSPPGRVCRSSPARNHHTRLHSVASTLASATTAIAV